ncbi:MAG TPA: hypothetical protein VGL61_17075 [Kofleriaceae bacterium]|jgi:hypothetical protein
MGALVDKLSWHVRGIFAFSPLRDLGFAARAAFQLAEVRARKAMVDAHEATDMTIDRALGYITLAPDSRFDALAATGSSIAGADVGKNMGGKAFFRARFSTDDEVAILLRAALDRRILAAVTRYLGTIPVICDADFYCSMPHGPPWTKSQLWHCDDDGARVVKLFVYCEDVDANNGPLEFVDARTSQKVRRAVHYRYAGRRYRVSDTAMEAHRADSSHITLAGARTSGLLIDTSRCFHRGSRIVAKDKRRVAAIVTYVPASGRTLPLRLREGNAPLARFATRFADPVERAVLGVPITG